MKKNLPIFSQLCLLTSFFLAQAPALAEPTASGSRKQTPEGKAIEEKIAKRDFPEALNLLNKYLQLRPNSASAYLKRGEVNQLMGKNSEALIDFSTAIKLDPKCTPAYLYRSVQYKRLNQLNRAKQDLMKLHEIDPVRFRNIDEKSIDDAFKKVDLNASKRAAEYPFLNTFAEARAAGFAGDHKKSFKLFDQLIQNMPANKAKFDDKKDADRFAALCYYNRSYSYLIGQRYDLALTDLNAAIENYPDYHDALINRAKLYEIIKNPGLAQKDRARAAQIEKIRKSRPGFGL